MTDLTATLVVNDDHAKCDACGGHADLTEDAHRTLMWSVEDRPGCGARFIALTSDLPMTPRLHAELIKVRPDLPILGEPIN